MLPNQLFKIKIKEFWDSFGGKKTLGFGFSEEKKLNKLIELSNFKIIYKSSDSLKNKRDKFNKIKFDRHSLKSHKTCFICLNLADIRHHIIQLQNGGINSKKNLVSLCNGCHKKIHNWL